VFIQLCQEADGLYKNLKAVIFIAIADYIVFPDKTEFKSEHVILDKNSHEHDLQDFSFTFVALLNGLHKGPPNTPKASVLAI
jgi:hypothetical protein